MNTAATDKATTANEAHPILLCCISPLPIQSLPDGTWSQELVDALVEVWLVRCAIVDAVVLNANARRILVGTKSRQVIENARVGCF
ncbi:hypothetical protein KCU71_g3019, partial [Aureobasidium melanogenum]